FDACRLYPLNSISEVIFFWMMPVTRPASEFHATWSPRLNVFAIVLFCATTMPKRSAKAEPDFSVPTRREKVPCGVVTGRQQRSKDVSCRSGSILAQRTIKKLRYLAPGTRGTPDGHRQHQSINRDSDQIFSTAIRDTIG